MVIKDLYKKDIARDLNPAVSAGDLTKRTVETEIDEYVFTDDIINGLYSVLSAIMEHPVNHNGIWINGFFGSGKSHFLKYIGYCVNPLYREKALARFKEAVCERDPLQNVGSKSEVTIDEFNRLAAWIRQATVDIVLFNIGAVHDTNANQREVFTQVFWHQFNKFRGYNSENLALAQHLEKVLDHNGKFDAFKQRLAEEGFEWSEQAGSLAVAYLDHLLDIAIELVPGITTDAIKEAIVADSENVSPEAFCRELKEYITAKQNPHYRLLFLVDEVSQFIGDNKQLLLQLQEIVTGLCNTCGDKVWLACTAQQDLTMLMTNMQILDTSDD
ncbi:MAG: BREX system P-loop protein BrxC, partial [Prevotellaceae bacterium]|nr:BREX system P-loop protein BrxC [Prevotellaceae bacterium]